MAGKSLSAHLEREILDGIKQISEAEGRPTSQVAATGIRAIARLPASARQVLYSLDGGGMSPAEIEHIMRIVGRSLVVAHRKTLMGRYAGNLGSEDLHGDNRAPLTEFDVAEIAVEACR